MAMSLSLGLTLGGSTVSGGGGGGAVNGDVIQFEILGASSTLDTYLNPDGFIFRARIKGGAAGGTMDATKVVVAYNRIGHDGAGNVVTLNKTNTGVGRARQLGPNDALAIETVVGSDLDVYGVLDHDIYSDDTITSVTISSGFYTGSNAGSSQFTPANNSTFTARRPHGMWVTPHHQLVQGGTTADVEILMFHQLAQKGTEVASVWIQAMDASYRNSAGVSGVAGNWSVVSTMADSNIITGVTPNIVQVFRATVDVSAPAAGDCYYRAVAYSHEGSRVWDSSNYLGLGQDGTTLSTSTTGATGTNHTRQADGNCAAHLHFYNDKTSTYKRGYFNVDLSTGNDTTGTIYASQGAADAGLPFLTVNAALAKLVTYNNAAGGGLTTHNDIGGGVGNLMDGDHAWMGGSSNVNATIGSVWFKLQKHSTATRANCKLNSVIAAALVTQAWRVLPRRTWLEDVRLTGATVGITNSQTYLYGGDFGVLAEAHFNRVAIDSVSGVATSFGNSWHYAIHLLRLDNCTIGANVNGAGGGAASGNQSVSVNGSTIGQGASMAGNHWAVGNQVSDGALVDCPRVGNAGLGTRYQPDVDVPIFAFNTWLQSNLTPGSGISACGMLNPNTASSGTTSPTSGFVFVQNLIEQANNIPAPGVTAKGIVFCADGNTATCPDLVVHCNTVAGERFNFSYNEITGSPALLKRGAFRFNLGPNFNMKRDNNDASGETQEAARSGVYANGYHVNSEGNMFNSTANTKVVGNVRSWYGEAWKGLNGGVTNALTLAWVDNKSRDGGAGATGVGGGDYHLGPTSSGLTLIANLRQPLPKDLFGAARPSTGGPPGALVAG